MLVLLKLLLATVSAGQNANNTQVPQSATSGVFPPVATRTILLSSGWFICSVNFIAPEQVPAVPPTLDETDVTRHREITSKAVSAILLLVLKWFKASRKSLMTMLCYAAKPLYFRCHEIPSPRPTFARYQLFVTNPQNVWTARSQQFRCIEG